MQIMFIVDNGDALYCHQLITLRFMNLCFITIILNRAISCDYLLNNRNKNLHVFIRRNLDIFDRRNKLLCVRLNINAVIILGAGAKDRQNENAAINSLMIHQAGKQTISLDALSRYEKN